MYGKVFQSIFTGSLYGQYEATVVMMACIVLSDRDGVLDYTPEALAGATGYPVDVVKEGLRQLQEPDPNSRSEEYEGRRVVPLEEGKQNGWIVVNKAKYRDTRDLEDVRDQTRERVKRHREKKRGNADVTRCSATVTPVTLGNAIQMKIQDTDEEKRERKHAAKRRLPSDWEPTETLIGWARGKHPTVDLSKETEKFKDHWEAKGEVRASWDATWRNWIRRAEEYGEKDRSGSGKRLSAVERVQQATGGARF